MSDSKKAYKNWKVQQGSDIIFPNQVWQAACDWKASAVVPEWISVDENLPIDVGQVLMIFGEALFGTCNPTIETGYYDKESETWRFWTFDREVRGFGVTHWMKLPALPKQDPLN
jgi:hypothetical protein